MTEPLISIIVPVYRVESYLSRCVDSLLAQTYQNLEIILVDDGSPDQCPQICEDYAKKEERIHVIHQENRGLSGARNAGIDVAKGEYLAFVDSDDYVSDDYIQVMYDAIKATGCAISQCRFTYTKGEKLKENRGTGAFRIYRGNSLMEKLYGNEEEATWFVVAWNKLYRRDLFETIRYPEGRIHEDEATTYLLFDEAKKEERIRFFDEHGYTGLMPSAYRKLCDACITFYFRCTDNVEEAAALKKELKDRLKAYEQQGAEWIEKLPARTRMGYKLFEICPAIYGKLLSRMQEAG